MVLQVLKSGKSAMLKQDGGKSLNSITADELVKGTENLYLYIKTVRVNERKYRYLIIEEYLGYGKRKTLLKMSVDEAIKALLRCGGWDSNPRRPTPAGLKPEGRSDSELDFYGSLKQYVEPHLSEFFSFCVKTASADTCSQYMSYIQRGYEESNKWSVLAWKKFMKWLCSERGIEVACKLYEKIKCKRSGVDMYVPSESEVLETVGKAEDPFKTVYLVLLQSGLRLNEATYLLRNIDKLRKVKQDGFYRVELGLERGSKKAFNAYLIDIPPKVMITDKEVSEYARKNRLLQPKYVRKYVATKMLELGIPSDVVDFIQGRTPSKILTRHYLNLITLADAYYLKYAEYVKHFIRPDLSLGIKAYVMH